MKKRISKAKYNLKDFWHNFVTVLRRNEMVILPGNLSFFFVLAVIPSLALLTLGASILNLSTDFLYNFLSQSFSPEIADMILGVNINISNTVGIHFIVALLFGLYIASNGADSLITASNAIYGIKNKSWSKRRLKALGLTFLIIILLVFMLIVPVFGNNIISLIEEVNLNPKITNQIILIFKLLKGPISWLIMFIFIKIIFTIAPDKKEERIIDYGAIFTTFGWIIGTKIYSGYVTNYASYKVLYGSLASIVVLMIWIYFLSLIFVVGMALNSQKDELKLTETGTIKEEK